MNAQPDKVRELLEAKITLKGRSGSDVNYVCPFCFKNGEDHTLHVNYSKGEWGCALCHGCWYGTRDLRLLLRTIYGYLPKHIDRLLNRSRLVGKIEDLFKAKAEEGEQHAGLPSGFRKLPMKPVDIMSRLMLLYLKDRGFTYDDIDAFDVGYVPNPSDDQRRITGYIIFPFYVDDRVVYWQGRRCVGSAENKSYNPPATGKKSLLFGYAQAVGKKTVFLAEGPLDAIAWGPGGVALTGKVLQPAQVRVLSLLDCENLIVCLDPEEAARTKELAHYLQRRVSYMVGYLILKKGDPADNKSRLHRVAKRRTQWIGGDWLKREAEDRMSARHDRCRCFPRTRNFSDRVRTSLE